MVLTKLQTTVPETTEGWEASIYPNTIPLQTFPLLIILERVDLHSHL